MAEPKRQVGVRLSLEEKQKLDALASLLGVSTTKCVAILVDKAYTDNKTAIQEQTASIRADRTAILLIAKEKAICIGKYR